MRGDDHLVPDLVVRLVLSSHLLVGHEAHDYVVVLGPSDLLVGQHVVPEDRLLGVRHVVLVDEHLGLSPVACVALLLTLLVGHEAHCPVVDHIPHELLVVSLSEIILPILVLWGFSQLPVFIPSMVAS